MIINQSERFNETQVIETLENGLTVLIVSKPEFLSNAAVLGTPFGGRHLNCDVDGEEVTFPAGTAHFLEHKLFEKEDMDILSVFTNMGAQANAFTSYNETAYTFNNMEEIKEPLQTLLDFVSHFEISEASVEKEKGIIIEELLMYQQIPGFQLSMELLKSLYHVHGLNQDIAGSVESVSNISLHDLQQAYRINYHPSQMVLSIVTHYPAEEILSMVKEIEKKRPKTNALTVTKTIVEEPLEVVRSYHEITMNVETPKVSVGYKQSVHFVNYEEMLKHNMAIRFLLEMTFSNMNPHYQEWLNSGIINDYFNYQSSYGMDYGFIQFVGETENIDNWLAFVEEKLKELVIDEKLLRQLKRRTYGEMVVDMDDFESFAIDGMRAHFAGINLFDWMTFPLDLTSEDLTRAQKQLNFNNRAVVVVQST